jgi:hypothetical protein
LQALSASPKFKPSGVAAGRVPAGRTVAIERIDAMLNHNPDKSRRAAGGAGGGSGLRRLPPYGVAGILIMAAGEVTLLAGAGWIAQ